MSNQPRSPFHQGEQIIQQKLGVRTQMENFGRRVIRDHMPEQHQRFYEQLPFLIAGHSDVEGRVWASILVGQPGFAVAESARQLDIKALPVQGDPLADSLISGLDIGLLGIELESRRRNRMNGRVSRVDDDGFSISVGQSFGNCPQYIQLRDHYFVAPNPTPKVERHSTLDKAAKDLIMGADSFYVASSSGDSAIGDTRGADASHRGGKPGFVKVEESGDLLIPDFPGNNHFNTLGNFVENPAAGLLFIDFESGDLLSLSGQAEILWQHEDQQHYQGAQRFWRFRSEVVVRIHGALPLRWTFREWSPNSLLAGNWADTMQARDIAETKDKVYDAVVTSVDSESSDVTSVEFKLTDEAKFAPVGGQHVRVMLPAHAGNAASQGRYFSLSSAPSAENYRISVKRSGKTGNRSVSEYINSSVKPGDRLSVSKPMGDFVIESDGERPVIMLAGGIGITPLLAMAYEWLENAIRYRRDTPLMLISCQRDESEQLFDGELKALERSSGGIIRYVSVLSQPIGSPGNNPDYDFAGRLNVEILQHLLPLADYEFYLCGSAGFMQNGYDILRVLGVDDNRIFAEAFGPSSLKRDVPESASEDAVATTAVVEFSRSGRTETWTPDDGTLLEFAESLGIEAEFSCRAGRCGSCRVDKSAGSVVHRDAHISPDNGVLLCCAKPAASDDLIDERLTLEL